MEIRDLVRIVRRRAWVGALALAICAAAAWWQIASLPVEYAARARLVLLLERVPVIEGADAVVEASIPAGYTVGTRLAFLESAVVRERAAAIALAAEGRHLEDKDWERLVTAEGEATLSEWLRERRIAQFVPGEGRFEILAGRRLDVQARAQAMAVEVREVRPELRAYEVVVRGRTADEAAAGANALAVAAVVFSRYEMARGLREARDKLGELAAERTQRIEELRARVRESVEGALFEELERRIAQARTRMEELDGAIASAEEQRRAASERWRTLAAFESPAGVVDWQELSGLVDSDLAQALRRDLTGLRTDIAVSGLERRPDHPEFQKAARRASEMERLLREELLRVAGVERAKAERAIREESARVDRLRMERVQWEMALAQAQAQRDAVSPEAREIARLEREADAARDAMMRFESAARVQRPFFQIRETARAPEFPGYEQQARVAATWALVWLVAWAGLAYVLEYTDTRIRTDHDVRRHLDLTCVAILPRLPRGASPYLHEPESPPQLGEQFQAAATILARALEEKGGRVMAITSAQAGEGKTAVAVNLAIALARSERRVLFVSADLRRIDADRVLAVPSGGGLASWLESDEPAGRYRALVVPGPVERMEVFPAGRGAAGTVRRFESARFLELVARMRADYEVVVLDTPPVTVAGEAITLAVRADGVVMVLGAGVAKRRAATWAKRLLTTAGAQVIGAVLNFADRAETAEYYSYYYYSRSKRVGEEA